ncbi:hypothetical protein PT974_07858 [Cladobotryum mycophilum]|uniref:Rhodopsin domain-containing protein n=1 Tax=Cladobotryum mycophilum TaxID=491253 RepID=A0ABR0SBR5_9HYPO
MSSTSASEAAAKAAYKVTVEIWTLYSVAVVVTLVRTFARLRAVGLRNLTADDYLVWVGVLLYTAQSSLGYNVGHIAHGLANNGMTDAARAALSPDDPETHMRITGSKIQVAGWTVYSALISSLKLSVLAFYIRLTEGLGQSYRIRIRIGFAIVFVAFLSAILAIFLGCRPFHKYWQINPNPGNACQPAVFKTVVWVSFIGNLASDIYLLLIPLPMLWMSSLKTLKKVASTVVLGSGAFVLTCATLKSAFVLVDPVNGAELAGSWGIREAFTAVITTNLPMIFPLFRSLLGRLIYASTNSSRNIQKSPIGLRTIGGGGGSQSGGRLAPRSVNPLTDNLTCNGSQEWIVNDVKMQTLETSASTSAPRDGQCDMGTGNQLQISHDGRSQSSNQNALHVQDGW